MGSTKNCGFTVPKGAPDYFTYRLRRSQARIQSEKAKQHAAEEQLSLAIPVINSLSRSIAHRANINNGISSFRLHPQLVSCSLKQPRRKLLSLEESTEKALPVNRQLAAALSPSAKTLSYARGCDLNRLARKSKAIVQYKLD